MERPENLRVAVVVLGLLAFGGLYAWFLYETFTADDVVPTFSEVPVRIATGLAASLGAIFTLAVGVQSSRNRAPGPNPPALGAGDGAGPGRVLAAPGGGLVRRETSATDPIVRLSTVGAWLYLAIGLVALIVWIAKGEVTPDVVRNLASIWLGFVLAAFAAAVGAPPGPSTG